MVRQLKGLENAPVYDDQGRIIALGNQTLPRPADHTDQIFAKAVAQQSQFKQPLKIQTNNMDDAYNRSFVVPPMHFAQPTREQQANEQMNTIIQQALFQLFGGRQKR